MKLPNEAHRVELALIISYPTNASGIIVLLKILIPPKINLKFKKNQEIMRRLSIFVDHGIMAYNPSWPSQ